MARRGARRLSRPARARGAPRRRRRLGACRCRPERPRRHPRDAGGHGGPHGRGRSRRPATPTWRRSPRWCGARRRSRSWSVCPARSRVTKVPPQAGAQVCCRGWRRASHRSGSVSSTSGSRVSMPTARLRDSGVAGRRQRAVVDQAAAVLILQAALDAERSSGAPPGERVGPGRRRPRTKDGGRDAAARLHRDDLRGAAAPTAAPPRPPAQSPPREGPSLADHPPRRRPRRWSRRSPPTACSRRCVQGPVQPVRGRGLRRPGRGRGRRRRQAGDRR